MSGADAIPVVLCADDYAMHPAIDAAVLSLAQAGRVTATSCMTLSPRWPQAAQALKAIDGRVDLGVHFNLTEGFGAPAPGLASTIARAYLRLIDAAAVRRALDAQLDAFEAVMGRAPDFIDGHQHVHQFPVMRGALLDALRRRYGAAPPYVRSTVPARARWRDKSRVLGLLGGRHLTRRLAALGVPTNRGFAGTYDFDAPDEAAYGVLMRRWLGEVGPGALLMCHPADRVTEDEIGHQRPVEYRYLASEAFAQALADAGVCLRRFGEARHGL